MRKTDKFNYNICIASIKSVTMTLLTIVFLAITADSFSQSIFPSLSPQGRIQQTVGFTNIIIDYERPAARGRKIFGELVEYGKLWRSGAGHCSKVRFSKAVTIDNSKVAKGTYSILTIPDMNEWTVILNKDTTLYGIASYNERNDLLRFKVKPQVTNRYYESLTIDVDVVPNNAVVYIAWEKTQISFLVETESDRVVNDFVTAFLLTGKSKDSDEYAAAAEYYFYLNKDLDRALILIDKAIAQKDESWYYRQKIDILEKQGKYKEAIACATQAAALDQKRTDWDLKTRQQSEEEYKRRIAFFKSKLN